MHWYADGSHGPLAFYGISKSLSLLYGAARDFFYGKSNIPVLAPWCPYGLGQATQRLCVVEGQSFNVYWTDAWQIPQCTVSIRQSYRNLKLMRFWWLVFFKVTPNNAVVSWSLVVLTVPSDSEQCVHNICLKKTLFGVLLQTNIKISWHLGRLLGSPVPMPPGTLWQLCIVINTSTPCNSQTSFS